MQVILLEKVANLETLVTSLKLRTALAVIF